MNGFGRAIITLRFAVTAAKVSVRDCGGCNEQRDHWHGRSCPFTGGETAFSRTMDFDGDSVSSQAEFARQLRQSPHALIREWLAAPQNSEQDSEAQGGGPDSPRATFEQPSAETFLHRDYAAGVRVLFNTGGPDYHSLAVATSDGVMVIETPGSVASGKRLIERAGELGAVKYIAATHHHGDHSGGVAGAASSDRTLVVAASHRAFFEDMITAERRFLTFEFAPVDEPAFATIPARGEMTVGGRMVAYDAGPTGHSDAQLVFYVPDAKLLFQSDMTVFRWDGSVEPARTQTCRLRAFIREQELDVDVIVGGHGRPGSLDDLGRAIALMTGDACQ